MPKRKSREIQKTKSSVTLANAEKIIPRDSRPGSSDPGSLSADWRIGRCDIGTFLLSLNYPSSLVGCAPSLHA